MFPSRVAQKPSVDGLCYDLSGLFVSSVEIQKPFEGNGTRKQGYLPPNKFGFRARKPVKSYNEPTQQADNLPDLPELADPAARRRRLERLESESAARAEAEKFYVSIGGTLVDSWGNRDLVRTARIKEELRTVEEKKRREREVREKDIAVKTAWECYESRWSKLLSNFNGSEKLGYEDVPWPLFGGCKCHPGPADLDESLRPSPSFSEARIRNSTDMDVEILPNPYLTPATLQTFLFHHLRLNFPSSGHISRKDTIQKCFLRWHPDKFNARVLMRVRDEDREAVRVDASKIVQILADWKQSGLEEEMKDV